MACCLRVCTVICRELLMKNCECAEEGTRNVVAECLGKLALIDPVMLLPKLKSHLARPSALIRSTVITAVKFTISDQVYNTNRWILYVQSHTVWTLCHAYCCFTMYICLKVTDSCQALLQESQSHGHVAWGSAPCARQETLQERHCSSQDVKARGWHVGVDAQNVGTAADSQMWDMLPYQHFIVWNSISKSHTAPSVTDK